MISQATTHYVLIYSPVSSLLSLSIGDFSVYISTMFIMFCLIYFSFSIIFDLIHRFINYLILIIFQFFDIFILSDHDYYKKYLKNYDI